MSLRQQPKQVCERIVRYKHRDGNLEKYQHACGPAQRAKYELKARGKLGRPRSANSESWYDVL